MEKIVTKDWLRDKLADPSKQIVVLGRALLAIYRRQTELEKAAFATKYANGIGFSGPDAKLGSRCAEYFQKNGTLASWMAKVWLVEKASYPRICKYAKQLNEIANEKKARQASILPV